jgi:hypothetical protein
MNGSKSKTILYIVSAVALLLIVCGGCKDDVENWIDRKGETVYDTLDELSGARILAYRIENVSEKVYSAVDDSAHTITVYLPHYFKLSFIDPEITLPEGARISPDAEELVSVFSDTPFVYTVTSGDGDEAQYTVIPLVQQPAIVLNELSTETNTASILFNRSIAISGKNFIPDFNVTKVYAIHENGTELLLGTYTSGNERSVSMNFVPIAVTYKSTMDNIPAGLYWIEMRAYALTTRMKYPVLMRKP